VLGQRRDRAVGYSPSSQSYRADEDGRSTADNRRGESRHESRDHRASTEHGVWDAGTLLYSLPPRWACHSFTLL